jgi:kynurenine formamidase
VTADRVKEAAGLVKAGKIYQLGRVYEHGMPMPPGSKRHYSLTIPGSPTGVDGELVYHDEMFSGEIGQVGTQFDGLGHVGIRVGQEDIFYNGFKRSEFGKAYGLEKLGVEQVGAFFSRGVLLDVAAYKGVDRLKAGEAITAGDIQSTLKMQRIEIREGDIVLIHTGHGKLWMTDNEAYSKGEPGIDLSAARWLADRKITMVGADTWAVEVTPPVKEDEPFGVVHMHLLVRHGIYIIENLDLGELARDKAYEFAFVYAPLRLKGATGSPGNPIAVR